MATLHSICTGHEVSKAFNLKSDKRPHTDNRQEGIPRTCTACTIHEHSCAFFFFGLKFKVHLRPTAMGSCKGKRHST